MRKAEIRHEIFYNVLLVTVVIKVKHCACYIGTKSYATI